MLFELTSGSIDGPGTLTAVSVGVGGVITNADLLHTVQGGQGSVANTFEDGEIHDSTGVGNTLDLDLEYIGTLETGDPVGRVFIFFNSSNSRYYVTSLKDYTTTAVDSGDEFPNTIDTSLIDTSNFAHCFVAGTMIATPHGEIAVEDIARDDLVLTADGRAVPVKWVGRQAVPMPAAIPESLEPVLISAGALGADLPVRDLILSADHGLILDGVVANASALVNGTTVRFAALTEPFTYYHIETEAHDVLLANGAPAESFLDVSSRRRFDNYQEFLDLYGAEPLTPAMSMPRVSSRRLLPPALKARLGLDERPLAQDAQDMRRSA